MAARGAKASRGGARGGGGGRTSPARELEALKASLTEGAAPARGYWLSGEERYFQEQALDAILSAGMAAGLEVSRHDASDPTRGAFELQKLVDDLTARPMFAEARLIVLRGAEKVLKKTGKKDAPASRAVQAFLESGDGSVVVCSKGLRADHAVAKAIAKAGGASVACRKLWADPPPWDPDPRKSELCQWLGARARGLGIPLNPDQAALLVESVGDDMFQLETELEKLRVGGKEALESLGIGGASSPWKVADQLIDGRTAEASKGLRALYAAGFRQADGRREVSTGALAALLLGSLSKAVRGARAVHRARGRGLDAATIEGLLESAGLAGTPAAKIRVIERAGSRDAEAWRRMARDVLSLERRTRTGIPVDEADFQRLVLSWRPPRRGRVR